MRATDVVVVLAVLWLVPQLTGIGNEAGFMASFQNTPGYLGIGQSVFGLDFHTPSGGDPLSSVSVLRGGPPAQWVLLCWFAICLLPNLALGFRRLHDQDLPGWAAFFAVLPVADLVLLLLALRAGSSRPVVNPQHAATGKSTVI